MCISITGVPIELDSKARAIQYAISLSTSTDKNNKIGVDLVLASGIYSFITERINLPDVSRNLLEDACIPLLNTLKGTLERLEKRANDD